MPSCDPADGTRSVEKRRCLFALGESRASALGESRAGRIRLAGNERRQPTGNGSGRCPAGSSGRKVLRALGPGAAFAGGIWGEALGRSGQTRDSPNRAHVLIGDEEHRRGAVGLPSFFGGVVARRARRPSNLHDARAARREAARSSRACASSKRRTPGDLFGTRSFAAGNGVPRGRARATFFTTSCQAPGIVLAPTHAERPPGAGVPDRARAGPRSRAGERSRFTACSRHDRSRSGVDPPRKRARFGRRGTSVLQWREPLDLRRAVGNRVEPEVSRRVGARL